MTLFQYLWLSVPYVVSIAMFIISLIYLWFKYKYTHWMKLGIEFVEPSFPFGNLQESFSGRKEMGAVFADIYKKIEGKFGGCFMISSPTIVFKDLELLKTILIKDFNHFADRGFHIDEENDPLSAHLLALSDQKWKRMRQKLTPTFTTGKIKEIFPTILRQGDNLQVYLSKQDNSVLEMRNILQHYTMGIIASVAFGIDINCIDNPELEFNKMAKKSVEPTVRNFIMFFVSFMFPKLFITFKIKTIPDSIDRYWIEMVKQTIDYREKNKIVRRDFMQLLIQMRNSGNVQEDGQWNLNVVDEKSKQLSINEIAAQSFIFILAGFETSASAMSFCLFELAKNEALQKRAQKCVDDVMVKHNGVWSYDAISEMKFLEQCLDETLRIYPSATIFARIVTKDYTIPDTDIVLKKGTNVMVPVLALHMDPQHFPEPKVFNPDRFAADAEHPIPPFAYLPFGEGPRSCIGMRFAKITSRFGIALLLSKFNFSLGPDTPTELTMDPKAALLNPLGGIHLRVTNRK